MGAEEPLSEEIAGEISVGSAKVFGGEIVLRLLDYVLVIALARYLKPDLYGIYATGFMLSSILLTLSNLGIFSGMTRFVSKYIGTDDTEQIFSIFVVGTGLSLLISTAMILLISPNLGIVSDRLFDGGNESVIFLFLLLVPFRSLYNSASSLLTGFNDMSSKVGLDVLRNVSQVAVILCLIYLDVSLWTLVLGSLSVMVSSSVLASALGVWRIRRETKSFRLSLDSVPVSELLIYSLPLVFVRISNLGMQWGDIFLLSYLTSSSTVGVYRSAFSLSQGLSIVLIGFSVPFFPLASRLYSQTDHDQLEQLFQSVTRWIYTLSIPIFVFTFMFAGEIVLAFFGAEYQTGATILQILMIGTFIAVLAGNSTQLLKATDMTRAYFYVSFATMVLNLVLNLLLIPILGMRGAAVATMASLAILNILVLAVVYRELSIWGYRPLANYAISTSLSIGLIAPLVLVGDFISGNVVILVALLYYGTYLAVLPFSGAVEKSEFRIIKQFIYKNIN